VCSAGPASASVTLIEGALSNARMRSAGASDQRSLGQCAGGESPQLMRGPLDGHQVSSRSNDQEDHNRICPSA
jgi:hypothetical protein